MEAPFDGLLFSVKINENKHGSRGLPPKYGQTVDAKPLTANSAKKRSLPFAESWPNLDLNVSNVVVTTTRSYKRGGRKVRVSL